MISQSVNIDIIELISLCVLAVYITANVNTVFIPNKMTFIKLNGGIYELNLIWLGVLVVMVV